MIRGVRFAAIAALAALVISLAAPFAFAAVKKPTATVVFSPTVHVVGAHFKPNEKVMVTLVSVDTTWTKKAVAKKTGAFTVQFGAIPLNACNEYTLKVVGSLKSRASESHPVEPC